MKAPLTQLPSPLFVLGPAYCGKSEWAHQLLSPAVETQVLGTAPEAEPAFATRIATLQSRRPGAWESRSVGSDLTLALGEATIGRSPCPQVLIDSMSQWVALLTLSNHAGNDQDLEMKITERIDEFLHVLSACHSTRIVIISAEVGGGPSPARSLERVYRHMVGLANQRLAAMSSTVVTIQAGLPQFLKC